MRHLRACKPPGGRVCTYGVELGLAWPVQKSFIIEMTVPNLGIMPGSYSVASESRIPGWSEFHLDTEPDGTVYKPDSLNMEAVKP